MNAHTKKIISEYWKLMDKSAVLDRRDVVRYLEQILVANEVEEVLCSINEVECAYCHNRKLVADGKLKRQIALREIEDAVEAYRNETGHYVYLPPTAWTIEWIQNRRANDE